MSELAGDYHFKNTFCVEYIEDDSTSLIKGYSYRAREGIGLYEGKYYICELNTYYPKELFKFIGYRKSSPDSHYKKSVEPIDIIEAFKLNFNLGNVVKYVCRANYKENKKEDLRKALWYLNREFNKIDNE